MAIGPYHLLQCFISACSAYHEGFLVGRDPKHHVLVNGHVLMHQWRDGIARVLFERLIRGFCAGQAVLSAAPS